MSHEKLKKRLVGLASPLSKLFLRFESAEFKDCQEVFRLLHQPWQGSESYAFWFFPPARKKDFKAYQKLHQIEIPESYQNFLLICNGVQVFDFELFGMPPSMLKEPPLMDRSGLQCVDLATQNRTEKYSYEVDSEWFMFGGRCYSDDENCGYFLSKTGTIYSCLADGEKVKQWRSFSRFLEAELVAAEEFARNEFPKEWKQIDKNSTGR